MNCKKRGTKKLFEKKPFIIMDDPFTNLDEKRLAAGKKVLSQMAEDYQVIYLTCHQSRVPGGSSDLQGQHQAESK